MQAIVGADNVWVEESLRTFVDDEVLPGTRVERASFWSGFAGLVRELTPRNEALLQRRGELQALIDAWHRQHPGPAFDPATYTAYLRGIGYLQQEGPPFLIDPANVDAEIAVLAGPQLVVPVSNARYALNAANARWGSLYDALYGSDAIANAPGASQGAPNGASDADSRGAAYDSTRGGVVIAYGRDFLDEHFSLTAGTHADATAYRIVDKQLRVYLKNGVAAGLNNAAALRGFQGSTAAPSLLLLEHHGLHVELRFDRTHAIGRDDAAGICDIVLESAVTSIQDCEDSVAAVDPRDKIQVYRNWLGLMQGTLEARIEKTGKPQVRRLKENRRYLAPDCTELVLPGRSLMLVRNVGHHMLSDMVTLNGRPIPETFIDGAITSLIGMHDLSAPAARRNSLRGSIYIVKPKMHGPQEVAFACELFAAIEGLLGLTANTLKMGIMDEERRTTVNLAECIRAARHRVVFINTGFLDRTGDEIHTSMEAAPVVRKHDLKKARWLDGYERQNVDIGIACGLPGRAQIGKGMWAMPDLMADMLKTKMAHPLAGASTAWVPSPVAATLHAIHYHQVNVREVQARLAARSRASLAVILTPPLAATPNFSAHDVEQELDNNLQSILGYVVRWIDAGVGCSKVLDYYGVALMEDRATLRISSQHLANWLHHGVCTKEQVMKAMHRMARVVDQQNAADSGYQRLTDDPDNNIAFKAACDLVFDGREQPNGYTEKILHARRKLRKAAQLLP